MTGDPRTINHIEHLDQQVHGEHEFAIYFVKLVKINSIYSLLLATRHLGISGALHGTSTRHNRLKIALLDIDLDPSVYAQGVANKNGPYMLKRQCPKGG